MTSLLHARGRTAVLLWSAVATVCGVVLVLGLALGGLLGRGADPGVPDVPLWGASFQRAPGESYAEALDRTDQALGELDVVRVFYPGAPDPWPGKVPGRDVVVSFKLSPAEVLAGDHDERMRAWFSSAPRDTATYWVYWHEPEDQIERGRFTADQFRRAFARLDALADEAQNPRLRSTLVLMSWTLQHESGRDWRDYYPGKDVVDVFAWDVYDRGKGRCRGYCTPVQLFDGPRRVSESVGDRFAVAELGVVRAPDDDGSRRAAWITESTHYLRQHRAEFVAWFNFVWEGDQDFRLVDPPSRRAWRAGTSVDAITG